MIGEFAWGLRLGWRRIVMARHSSLIIVLTLTLGIASTTAISSLFQGIVLRPLPYHDPDRLVSFSERNREKGWRFPRTAPANVVEWQNERQAFEGVAAARFRSFTLTGAGEPEIIRGASVSVNLMDLLGIHPAYGRPFSATESVPGRGDMAILGHGLWQRRFGADPKVVGQTIDLDHSSHIVIGIAPPGYAFPAGTEIWTPLSFSSDLIESRGRFLITVGRLGSGLDLAAARSRLQVISQRLAELNPSLNQGWNAEINPLYETIVGSGISRTLAIFLAAVLFLLLIACVNVAIVQLYRAADRRKEVTIHAALGAGRLRLALQFLAENLMLAIVSGLLGLAAAYWGTEFLLSLSPTDIARRGEVDILDSRVLGFAMTITLLTGLAFGIVPAVAMSNPSLTEALKGEPLIRGAWRNGALNIFLAIQTALVLVLLAGAGLMLNSFLRVYSQDPGIDPTNVLTLQLVLPHSKYPEDSNQSQFAQQFLEKAEQLPGFSEASLASALPGAGSGAYPVWPEGRPSDSDEPVYALFNAVTPKFFTAMGIQFVEGRAFTECEAEPAIVITENLASRFWGSQAVGQRLTVGLSESTSFNVSGIVRDIKYQGLEVQPMAAVFVSFFRFPGPYFALTVRRERRLSGLGQSLRQLVWSIDDQQPISRLAPMSELLNETVGTRRFNTLILNAFAIAGLALAALGIYGTAAYNVKWRTHEIAIRMSLGASRLRILMAVVARSMAVVGMGIALGWLSALGFADFASSLLYQVEPTDFATFALAAVFLALVALLASYFPARRAASIDPMQTIRCE